MMHDVQDGCYSVTTAVLPSFGSWPGSMPEFSARGDIQGRYRIFSLSREMNIGITENRGPRAKPLMF